MKLRPATLDDLDLLRHWDTQPHVIASGAADDAVDWAYELGLEPQWRDMLIGEIDGRPVGIVQIIDPAEEETHYWGDIGTGLRAIDIWIGEANDLGQGFGTAMMRQALDRCFADSSVRAVLIDPLASNTDAHRFYERLGFRAVGRRRFGADDCIVYTLTREAWR